MTNVNGVGNAFRIFFSHHLELPGGLMQTLDSHSRALWFCEPVAYCGVHAMGGIIIVLLLPVSMLYVHFYQINHNMQFITKRTILFAATTRGNCKL